MSLVLLIVLIPMLNVVASSFSSGKAVSEGLVTIWPVDFSLDGYIEVFKNQKIVIGYGNTIFYTVCGTLINVVMTVLCAYPLSRSDLPGRGFFMFLFSFTMLFSGGLIPNFILMKDLNILDTRWVLIIPGAVGVYNMIITRTNFQQLPKELLEAAKIDGCSDFRFFATMAIPLSKAILAVITLFYAVGHWNVYFNAKIYLYDEMKMPLQIFLQQILLANQLTSGANVDPEAAAKLSTMADLLKYSLIIVASLPVWCIYPFIQKYFVQGVMIGSIKG
jgi:multiple sugar transport system permease protein/putative aldouronate transport system permease protein